jgi:UDP-glucose:(heptosyl)LPS alpha-1,3-glucosyltransferase
MSPLRIAFLIDRWQPRRGGAEQALTLFASRLEERGHEVFAIGLEGPRSDEVAPGRFVAVTTHGWTRGSRERRLAEAMLATAEANRCDLTVGVRHLPRVDFYWPHGGAHAATMRSLRKRAMGRHRVFLDLEEKALAEFGARRVVCVSELVREEILDLYPTCAPRLVVVPNGIDLDRFHPEARSRSRGLLLDELGWKEEGTPIISFAARNPKLKGLPRLLRALAMQRKRPWRLVIAGVPRPRRWARRAKRLGLENGRVAVREELGGLPLAAGADLCVLPSRRDPCGLVVLEALACGTPVVISDAVGAKEALAGEAAGLVVRARGTKRELAEAISVALDALQRGSVDREVVRAGVAGRGLEQWLDRLEELLLDLAEEPRLA